MELFWKMEMSILIIYNIVDKKFATISNFNGSIFVPIIIFIYEIKLI